MREKIEFEHSYLEYNFAKAEIGLMFCLGYLPIKISYEKNRRGYLDCFITFSPINLKNNRANETEIFRFHVNKLDFRNPSFLVPESLINSPESMRKISLAILNSPLNSDISYSKYIEFLKHELEKGQLLTCIYKMFVCQLCENYGETKLKNIQRACIENFALNDEKFNFRIRTLSDYGLVKDLKKDFNIVSNDIKE